MTENQRLTEYIKEVLNFPDNVEFSVYDEDNNEKDLSNGIVNVWVNVK
jgi:predicted transcriptional regulator YdeE